MVQGLRIKYRYQNVSFLKDWFQHFWHYRKYYRFLQMSKFNYVSFIFLRLHGCQVED